MIKKDTIKKNLPIIIGILIFTIICLIIKYNYLHIFNEFDVNVKYVIDKLFNNNLLTLILKIITNMASTVGVLIVFIFSLLIFKEKNTRIILTLDLMFIGLLSFLLKNLFGRIRPLESLIKMPSSYSFPSGHTFFAVGFYGLILYFILKSNLSKNIKIILSISISLLIFLIGFSRIYLGVHHFTDVIGGLIYGIFTLILFINLYRED